MYTAAWLLLEVLSDVLGEMLFENFIVGLISTLRNLNVDLALTEMLRLP